MLDTPHMPPKKANKKPVQVSMDPTVLRQIDSDGEAKRLGRSAYIVRAVLAYMKAKRGEALDEQIRRAYAGKADELLKDVEAFLPHQVWSSDDDLVETGPVERKPARRAGGKR